MFFELRKNNLLNNKYFWISLVSLIILFSFFVSRAWAFKEITLIEDGVKREIKTYAPTVEKLVQEQKLDLNEQDEISLALENKIQDKMEIEIARAERIKIIVDGKTREISMAKPTTKKILKATNISLGELDKVKHTLNYKYLKVKEFWVIRVKQEKVVHQEVVKYETIKRKHQTWNEGKESIIQAGKNGLAEKTFLVTYEDGIKMEAKVIKREIIKKSKPQVIAYGSNKVETVVARSGNARSLEGGRGVTMVATAYTYTGNRTATGMNPRRGIVAVDPRVIPLGTKVYVEGYGYAEAQDTGGAIKGHKIDVFLETERACINWGRKKVNVYIVGK